MCLMNAEELIYFIHIPKTGGSTMTNIIRDHFLPSEKLAYFHNEDDIQQKLKQVNLNEIKIIYGHYLFGIHEHIERPFSYFTLLRHPVERVISLYYYLKSIEGEPYEVYRKMTLDEFIEQKIEENIQTSYLSGNLSNPKLTKAMRNLRTYFEVVGTTEQFDETLYLLGKRYGWTKLCYERVNVTKSRPRIEEVSDETIRRIKKIHNKDMLLYRFTQKLLKKHLSELDDQQLTELRDFKNKQIEFELNHEA